MRRKTLTANKITASKRIGKITVNSHKQGGWIFSISRTTLLESFWLISLYVTLLQSSISRKVSSNKGKLEENFVI